tara:strand:+ start:10 stop:450 length:441 start_codon:yes stop_codon:yes gene_type:complete
MEIIRLLVSAVVATSIMTAFSYILSKIRNKQFREPELLNIVLSSSDLFNLELSKKSRVGWILHYLIGLIFVLIFEMLLKFELIPISITSGAIFGFVAGILGVFGWKLFFYLSEKPSEINWNIEYYLQLIVAHILFGISTAAFYLLW